MKNIAEVNSNDKELHYCISSGMFQIHYIYKRFMDDVKQRKNMIVWIAHPDTRNEKRWMANIAEWEKLLKYIQKPEFNITFRQLPTIIPDTQGYEE